MRLLYARPLMASLGFIFHGLKFYFVLFQIYFYLIQPLIPERREIKKQLNVAGIEPRPAAYRARTLSIAPLSLGPTKGFFGGVSLTQVRAMYCAQTFFCCDLLISGRNIFSLPRTTLKCIFRCRDFELKDKKLFDFSTGVCHRAV